MQLAASVAAVALFGLAQHSDAVACDYESIKSDTFECVHALEASTLPECVTVTTGEERRGGASPVCKYGIVLLNDCEESFALSFVCEDYHPCVPEHEVEAGTSADISFGLRTGLIAMTLRPILEEPTEGEAGDAVATATFDLTSTGTIEYADVPPCNTFGCQATVHRTAPGALALLPALLLVFGGGIAARRRARAKT